jgi:pimeloyl-ACP methyl ester carboxylesterase
MSVRRREITVAGIRSPVLESGPADAREGVLFVHGNPGSSADWEDLVRRTGAFARGVAVDMPGFGRADKPERFSYDVPGYARHIAGVVGALGLGRVHLVVHDFGGIWGLAWAAENLPSLASLTMIDIGVLRGYRWHRYARIWRLPLVGELFNALVTTAAARRLLLGRAAPGGVPRAHVERMLADFDRGTRRAVLRLYRSGMERQTRRAMLASLRSYEGPVLVLWGRRDPYVPAHYADRQRDVWPRAQVVVLADSGHWPMLDAPERTAGVVVPFLREHLGRTALAE